MVDQGIRARARYLNESSHLLARTSPAISRHLRSQLHTLATDYNLDLTDVQKNEACGACGNIMISGWTSRTYLDNKRSKRSSKKNATRKTSTGTSSSRKQNEEEAAVKRLCYECLICNRVTRQPLPAPSNSSQKEQEQNPPSKPADFASRQSNVTHVPTDLALGPPASSLPNVSSRRRAKARKQSGLQALLAKKKEESLGGGFATGFGLDLMDLMKTG